MRMSLLLRWVFGMMVAMEMCWRHPPNSMEEKLLRDFQNILESVYILSKMSLTPGSRNWMLPKSFFFIKSAYNILILMQGSSVVS